MEYNPDIHHRRSIRLKDYDYSSDGKYFVTICAHDKAMLFGKVVPTVGAGLVSARMALNSAGRMVETAYLDIIGAYKNVISEKHVIMPNHFHCIIALQNTRKDIVASCEAEADARTRADTRPAPTLDAVICAFKSRTTVEFINGVKSDKYPPFSKRVWQRNYYDHIIRNEAEYLKIWQYIDENPAKWADDCYYSG